MIHFCCVDLTVPVCPSGGETWKLAFWRVRVDDGYASFLHALERKRACTKSDELTLKLSGCY